VHTSLTLLSHALVAATTTTTTKKGSSIFPFVLLLGLFAVAYFVFLRPARNRQRAAVQARRQVEVGDEVTTTAGLIATVVAVEDDMLTLEIAPGVHCRYLPAAVLRVNGEDEEPAEDQDDAAPDASTHEVIDQPETVADETTIRPADPTDGTTETPGAPTS
jgi:preprotein translocase subunit YajC